MDLREIFATNLRRLRHERGLSQDDLAYEADVSRSYLSQIEKGSFHVSLKVIGKLSEALKVEPAEFLKILREETPPGKGAAAGKPPSPTG
jgi:transcriptional regulator with XRE-family HTH domain